MSVMSEEEKKAVKELTDAVNEPLEVFENVVDTFKPVNLEQCRIILNLIEKQQKEIEEKSTIIMVGAEKVKQLEKEIEYLKEVKYYYEISTISKDKIREKIKKAKEIKWQIPKLVIEYFEELLEEN